MPRQPRTAPGGYVYHAFNRSVARPPLFQKDADYDVFERVLGDALVKHPIRLLAYSVIPNHWHFVLWPEQDDQLTAFLRWLAHTHTQRWHAHHHTAGTGHLYQGRFRAFPVQEDDHLYTVLRYVERNALRANLVKRAEIWRWSSLFHRGAGGLDPVRPHLHRWPLPYPEDWLTRVNGAETEAELEAVRRSVERKLPFGSEHWQKRTAKGLGLEYTFRKPGRPKKGKKRLENGPRLRVSFIFLQTLFIGPNSLVVEGVSDLLYIQTISGVLQSKGCVGLDSRWTITPVGGSDKVPTFVALMGAQKSLNIATLIDFQKGDQQTIENLYKKRLLKKSHVLTVADFTGKKEADIEDMFDDSFYIQLVNENSPAHYRRS